MFVAEVPFFASEILMISYHVLVKSPYLRIYLHIFAVLVTSFPHLLNVPISAVFF